MERRAVHRTRVLSPHNSFDRSRHLEAAAALVGVFQAPGFGASALGVCAPGALGPARYGATARCLHTHRKRFRAGACTARFKPRAGRQRRRGSELRE